MRQLTLSLRCLVSGGINISKHVRPLRPLGECHDNQGARGGRATGVCALSSCALPVFTPMKPAAWLLALQEHVALALAETPPAALHSRTVYRCFVNL